MDTPCGAVSCEGKEKGQPALSLLTCAGESAYSKTGANGCIDGRNGEKMSIGLISSGSLDAYLEQGGCLLLDVRSPDSYRHGHIAGAVNIPWPEEERKLRGIRSSKLIVVYCESGARSLSVCRKLSARGLRTRSLVGGLLAYRGKYLESENKD